MPFQKGKSGNPGGRPKADWTFLGLYKEALEEKYNKVEAKRLVAKKVVDMAISGDIQAIKELSNRIDGMPKQQTDITTDGDKINELRVIIEDSILDENKTPANPKKSTNRIK